MKHLSGVVCLIAILLGCTRTPSSESYHIDRFELHLDNVTESLLGARLTPAFFEKSRSTTWLGRAFMPEEYQPNRNQVVVFAFPLWQRLGGDPAIVGRTVQLNGAEFRVLGIMPKGFPLPDGAELLVPVSGTN